MITRALCTTYCAFESNDHALQGHVDSTLGLDVLEGDGVLDAIDILLISSSFSVGHESEWHIFGTLRMSKACDLNIVVVDSDGDTAPIAKSAMKAAHEMHLKIGMDWSAFLEIKRRRGEAW